MPGVSVVTSTRYREAFSLHALGKSMDDTQREVLEAGRREARLPEGRYPLPCGVEYTPVHVQEQEVAAARLDGPAARPHRAARWTPWDDEER